MPPSGGEIKLRKSHFVNEKIGFGLLTYYTDDQKMVIGLRGHSVTSCQIVRQSVEPLPRWWLIIFLENGNPFTILDSSDAHWDHPQSSCWLFIVMQSLSMQYWVLYFVHLAWKCHIHASKIQDFGVLTPTWAAFSTTPPKGISFRETRHTK